MTISQYVRKLIQSTCPPGSTVTACWTPNWTETLEYGSSEHKAVGLVACYAHFHCVCQPGADRNRSPVVEGRF